MEDEAKASDVSISVVIPTLGREDLLLDCVDSILKNTYQNFELLIIDQNPEKTLPEKLAQRYPEEKRIHYFFRDQAGAARARNFGLSQAIGEIIVFIDDDLIVSPGCLQAYYELFHSINPRPAIATGKITPLWPGDRPEWFPKECEYILGLYNIGDEICPMPEFDQPMSANMAVLRQSIEKIGSFNESFGFDYSRKLPMIAGEDTLLGMSARKAGYQIYYHPKALVAHRISNKKVRKMNFLRRYFWEGITVILELDLIGKLGSRRAHFKYHTKYVIKMLILSLFPTLSRQPEARQNTPSMRMLHLSQAFNSLGTLYAIVNLPHLRRQAR